MQNKKRINYDTRYRLSIVAAQVAPLLLKQQ